MTTMNFSGLQSLKNKLLERKKGISDMYPDYYQKNKLNFFVKIVNKNSKPIFHYSKKEIQKLFSNPNTIIAHQLTYKKFNKHNEFVYNTHIFIYTTKENNKIYIRLISNDYMAFPIIKEDPIKIINQTVNENMEIFNFTKDNLKTFNAFNQYIETELQSHIDIEDIKNAIKDIKDLVDDEIAAAFILDLKKRTITHFISNFITTKDSIFIKKLIENIYNKILPDMTSTIKQITNISISTEHIEKTTNVCKICEHKQTCKFPFVNLLTKNKYTTRYKFLPAHNYINMNPKPTKKISISLLYSLIKKTIDYLQNFTKIEASHNFLRRIGNSTTLKIHPYYDSFDPAKTIFYNLLNLYKQKTGINLEIKLDRLIQKHVDIANSFLSISDYTPDTNNLEDFLGNTYNTTEYTLDDFLKITDNDYSINESYQDNYTIHLTTLDDKLIELDDLLKNSINDNNFNDLLIDVEIWIDYYKQIHELNTLPYRLKIFYLRHILDQLVYFINDYIDLNSHKTKRTLTTKTLFEKFYDFAYEQIKKL